MAGWASEPIIIGLPASKVTPVALGPEQTPFVTNLDTARRLPELTVLSTLAHADNSDPTSLFEALAAALAALDTNRAALYHDFMLTALPAATRKLLEEFMSTTNYPFQSDFARRHFAAGEAEGKAEGKAQSLLTVLEARGIEVSEEVRARTSECTDLEQLEEWIRRAATAERVSDLGGALID